MMEVGKPFIKPQSENEIVIFHSVDFDKRVNKRLTYTIYAHISGEAFAKANVCFVLMPIALFGGVGGVFVRYDRNCRRCLRKT